MQQDITWTNAESDLWRHISSLSRNELNQAIFAPLLLISMCLDLVILNLLAITNKFSCVNSDIHFREFVYNKPCAYAEAEWHMYVGNLTTIGSDNG